MKRFYASLAALTLVVSGIVLFNFMGGVSNAALPRDCDNNSIIYCGGITAGELADRYSANKTGDLDNVYNAYGLSATEMTHAGTMAKMGEVHKNGTVTVNGETVASDAHSIGRQNIFAGSSHKVIDGKTYYEHVPNGSFAIESIVAYVFFDKDGNFKAAVLTSCGNPVNAKPKPKPVYTCDNLSATKISRTEYSFTSTATAKDGATITGYTYDFGDGQKTTSAATTVNHTYTKPGTYNVKLSVTVKVNGETKTITGTKCVAKVVVETPPPTPVYSCDSLKMNKISRTEYSFDGKATAEGGATIVGYSFDFGDNNQQVVTNPTGVKHTYVKEGSYTVKMSVTVKVNGQEKTVTDAAKCVAQVTVTPPEECKPGIPVGDVRCNECKPGVPTGDERCTPCDIPGKEQFPKNSPECTETPAELPHTGPTDIIGGALGLGSIVTAASYYVASRRGLLAELLNR